MKLILHPLVQLDLNGIAEHVFLHTNDPVAAQARLIEARILIEDILKNPGLGAPLRQPGWRFRHGGSGRRLTVVYRHDAEKSALYVALIAFGGQNWTERVDARSSNKLMSGENG